MDLLLLFKGLVLGIVEEVTVVRSEVHCLLVYVLKELLCKP